MTDIERDIQEQSITASMQKMLVEFYKEIQRLEDLHKIAILLKDTSSKIEEYAVIIDELEEDTNEA